MPLSTRCDLETSPGRYCDKPAGWLALSADTPVMWADRDGGNASLGSFCTREHALAEPRPTLEAARRSHATVVGMCDEESVLDGWKWALAAYPNPIEMHIAKENLT